MHQKNLCQEIYIPATYEECILQLLRSELTI